MGIRSFLVKLGVIKVSDAGHQVFDITGRLFDG
jgi:hypothetical protein